METGLVEYISKEQSRVVRKRKTQVIEESLDQIVAQTGMVTAEQVITAAARPEHPLHEYFTWDDTEAAAKWRRAQATAMIIATKYVCYLKEARQKKGKPLAAAASAKAVPVRRFLPAFKAEGFRDRAEVLSDEESRKFLVEKKLSVLRGWCQSVIDIPELSDVRTQVLSAIA